MKRRSWWLLGVLAAMFLAGCATLANTSQQDRVYTAYAQCQSEGHVPNNIRLQRVESDGRYWLLFENGTHGGSEAMTCISGKLR